MANAAAGALAGRPSEQLVGMRQADLLRVLRADGSPISASERPEDSVVLGTPASGEHLVVGLDGQRRWVWEESTLLRSTTGAVRGAISLARDTTERRLAQEELRSSEERYRRIVETTQEGICQLDLAEQIVYANRRLGDLLDFPVEEMQGRVVTDFLSAEPGGPGAAQLRACLRNEDAAMYFAKRTGSGHAVYDAHQTDPQSRAAGARS